MVPITKSYRELGLDVDKEVGTRASDLGQVPADMSFAQFLSRKTVDEQNEMLGKGRAELWRNKTITLRQLLDFNGNPLTLKQLSDRYL
jgi:hypothetical protein